MGEAFISLHFPAAEAMLPAASRLSDQYGFYLPTLVQNKPLPHGTAFVELAFHH